MRLSRGMLCAVVAGGLIVGGMACQHSSSRMGGEEAGARPAEGFLAPVKDQKDLPNARYVTAKVISGGEPAGDAGFEALKAMGVKTIVSVDGSKPDVERAEKYGLRYVHLPIRYSGVTRDEGLAVAKALEELPGPIYIHCHHGKHRSAAAVTVACIYNGWLEPGQADTVLETFGTGEEYKGLWKAAENAREVPAEEVKDFPVKFVPRRPIEPLGETMVLVDQRWDHMKAIQQAGWKTPRNHPDLDPAYEALQLDELFREVPRTDGKVMKSAEFAGHLKQAEEGSRALQVALTPGTFNAAGAEAAFKQVSQACAACHKTFRN